MAEPSNEETIRRYLAAHTAHDYDTVGALRDPAWTLEWPPSGERGRLRRVRGHGRVRYLRRVRRRGHEAERRRFGRLTSRGQRPADQNAGRLYGLTTTCATTEGWIEQWYA